MVAGKAAKPTSYWFVGVSPRNIRNLLLAMGDRTYTWSELLALVEKKAILESNSKDVNLDTLVWQHERIARLLGMSEKRDAHYMVTSATRNSIGARGLQDPLQPKERRFFVERVFQSSTQSDS
ncbi:MAG: hypothetical protein MUP04_00930, partial [Anaerolineae bacterium]|nr:hypothetical protein [Anaerolineae bacterium]